MRLRQISKVHRWRLRMGVRKNIPCERFVNQYDVEGNGKHFICSKDNLCRECLAKSCKEYRMSEEKHKTNPWIRKAGLCSKCRIDGDEIPKYKDGRVVEDKDISCIGRAFGCCKMEDSSKP